VISIKINEIQAIGYVKDIQYIKTLNSLCIGYIILDDANTTIFLFTSLYEGFVPLELIIRRTGYTLVTAAIYYRYQSLICEAVCNICMHRTLPRRQVRPQISGRIFGPIIGISQSILGRG